MALNRQSLQDAIVAAMARQMGDTPVSPEARTFAADLATAVDDYVRAADVRDVVVQVGGQQGTQTGTGRVA